MKSTTRSFLAGLVSGAFMTVAGLVLVSLVVGILLSTGVGGRWLVERMMRAPPIPTPVEVRGAALTADYAWNLQTLEGETLPLGHFQGKTVFLNIWATWCGPCRAEMPSIERLKSAPEAEGVEFLLVTLEEAEAVREFVRRQEFALPVYLASERPEVFEGNSVPATFVITRGGRVVFRHRGAAKWDSAEFKEFLRQVAGPSMVPRREPA